MMPSLNATRLNMQMATKLRSVVVVVYPITFNGNGTSILINPISGEGFSMTRSMFDDTEKLNLAEH
jgi:hypothetical protein